MPRWDGEGIMGRDETRKRFEYLATRPDLPPGATSPMMDSQQMTDWLNRMDELGWEFVSYGATHWHGREVPQEWWVFRRAR